MQVKVHALAAEVPHREPDAAATAGLLADTAAHTRAVEGTALNGGDVEMGRVDAVSSPSSAQEQPTQPTQRGESPKCGKLLSWEAVLCISFLNMRQ